MADSQFNNMLKRFVIESENFLANNEKRYRMRFVMDLVKALINCIYLTKDRSINTPSPFSSKLEDSTLEIENLKRKLNQYKEQNSELTLRYTQLR